MSWEVRLKDLTQENWSFAEFKIENESIWLQFERFFFQANHHVENAMVTLFEIGEVTVEPLLCSVFLIMRGEFSTIGSGAVELSIFHWMEMAVHEETIIVCVDKFSLHRKESDLWKENVPNLWSLHVNISIVWSWKGLPKCWEWQYWSSDTSSKANRDTRVFPILAARPTLCRMHDALLVQKTLMRRGSRRKRSKSQRTKPSNKV